MIEFNVSEPDSHTWPDDFNEVQLAADAMRRIREEKTQGKPNVTLFECEATALANERDKLAMANCAMRTVCYNGGSLTTPDLISQLQSAAVRGDSSLLEAVACRLGTLVEEVARRQADLDRLRRYEQTVREYARQMLRTHATDAEIAAEMEVMVAIALGEPTPKRRAAR